ncbi:MAG: hypothetical protein RMJ07_06455 [Nitrososphaerota archaeon]|nr:hypothetical protein [Candidatus Bathyarchaeota archaeon]MDW8049296.1 hypothetical protein [Nitrososphaerota archaeon]
MPRQKTERVSEASVLPVPYIAEIERLALDILRRGDGKELREMLERYAERYAREYPVRA